MSSVIDIYYAQVVSPKDWIFVLHSTIQPADGKGDAMTAMEHEQAFVSVFVVPEKRARYVEFLGKPKRRGQITGRFDHFFDFVPALARWVERGVASELAPVLRARGAGDTAHVIGGKDDIDGKVLPLEQAIDLALAYSGGVVVSCVPGRLALYLQEFPPGDTFILSTKP